MQILQWIYIAVGLLTLAAVSIFTITQCLQWFLDILDRIRNPIHEIYYLRLFIDLSVAFHKDKKIEYILNQIAQKGLNRQGFNIWKFRDEVNKEFDGAELKQSNP